MQATEPVLFVAFALLLGVLVQLGLRVLPISLPYSVIIFLLGILWGFLAKKGLSHFGGSVVAVSTIDPHLLLDVRSCLQEKKEEEEKKKKKTRKFKAADELFFFCPAR